MGGHGRRAVCERRRWCPGRDEEPSEGACDEGDGGDRGHRSDGPSSAVSQPHTLVPRPTAPTRTTATSAHHPTRLAPRLSVMSSTRAATSTATKAAETVMNRPTTNRRTSHSASPTPATSPKSGASVSSEAPSADGTIRSAAFHPHRPSAATATATAAQTHLPDGLPRPPTSSDSLVAPCRSSVVPRIPHRPSLLAAPSTLNKARPDQCVSNPAITEPCAPLVRGSGVSPSPRCRAPATRRCSRASGR